MSSFGIDNQPLRYYNGKPVYLSLYLALAMAAGSVVTMLLQASLMPVEFLAFYPPAFLRGMLWQPFTYPFVNGMSFFTPLSILAFYFWGVEVEKYLGRTEYVIICGMLVAVPVVFALAMHFLGAPVMFAGNFLLVSGLLIAFATLYPDLDYIGGWIPLKWFAFASIACGSIMYFPARDWTGLFLLWLNCGVAFLMIRSARGLFNFKFKIPWPRKKPKLRVLPKAVDVRPARKTSAAPTSNAETEIDALLDKIASSGLKSLSAAEKTRLETLRQQLLRKTT